jgi:hypothetical protein
MTSMASPNMVGLRLSRGALRVLKERGVFAQSCVSLEHSILQSAMSSVDWSLVVQREMLGIM